MRDAIELLGDLAQKDVDWIFETGNTQRVTAEEVIINEGTELAYLYLVLEGLVGIYISAIHGKQLAALGSGEILGEISFLGDLPTTASVVALEDTVLLALSRDKLEDKLSEDPEFAARLYKSFAILASKRLVETVGALGKLIEAKADDKDPVQIVWRRISYAIEQFKDLMQFADREALKNDDMVPSELCQKIALEFNKFWDLVNVEIGDNSTLNESVKRDIGVRLQREVLPYLMITKTAERFYSKPRGYAGDFLTIEWIYQNHPSGSGRLGPLLDRCFLNQPPAKAVRNRRGLLAREINEAIKQQAGSPTKITSLACGPAREIFDVFGNLEDPSHLFVNLVDIDLQALAYVSDIRDKNKLKRQIKLLHANLIYLAIGRETIDVRDQDLVYSIGLIDYFQDKFVIKLLNYIHKILKPGGKVILGNFHPKNPTKVLMDHVVEWKLIHRTEHDMNRILESSAFKGCCREIQLEDEGINLFAACIKR